MSSLPDQTPRYRALIQLLRTAEDLWNASRIFFSRWDLSPSQFNVLNLLYANPGGMSQSDVSRLLIMHRSNATGLVDRLEQRGLVQREEHPSDRRAYRVRITPAGLDLVRRIHPDYFAAADRVWAEMSDSEVDSLLERLQDLAANAGAIALLSSTIPSSEAQIRGLKERPPKRRITQEPQSAANISPTTDDPLRISDL